MGKSENGPDMLDCSQLMRRLEQDLACQVSVLLDTDGSVGGGGLYIGVMATSRTLTVEGPAWTVATRHAWPHRDHKTFEGCLYCALCKLDSDVSEKALLELIKIA